MEKDNEKKITNENPKVEEEIKQNKPKNDKEPIETKEKINNEEPIKTKEEIEKEETNEEIKEDNNAHDEQVALVELKKSKKAKGSYFAGTIGAIFGGLVALLPWIITYIFTDNMVIPLFASFIPIGAFFGYKIFRGKIGKHFAGIVTIISILTIL